MRSPNAPYEGLIGDRSLQNCHKTKYVRIRCRSQGPTGKREDARRETAASEEGSNTTVLAVNKLPGEGKAGAGKIKELKENDGML